MARRPKPRLVPAVRDEDYYERVRERLDEALAANPNTAHVVQEAPLSKRHREDPLRINGTKKPGLK